MDRRKFIAGLMASAAAVPVVAALPAVRAHTPLPEVNWRYITRIVNVECDTLVDQDDLFSHYWRNFLATNEIIDDIPYKEIA